MPAAPALRIDPRGHPPMKARRFPVAGAADQPVLDRIVVDVIEVRLEIVLVNDRMLPESALPDSSPAFVLFACGNSLVPTAARQKRLRKALLNDTPTRGIIRVPAGQGPDRMQMIGQENDGVDFERPFRLALTEHLSEQRAISRNVKQWPPSVRHDGEKERPPQGPASDDIATYSESIALCVGRKAGRACPTGLERERTMLLAPQLKELVQQLMMQGI